MEEIFKKIPNYDRYMVSNKGAVKAIPFPKSNYRGSFISKERIKRQWKEKLGYMQTSVVDNDGNLKRMKVHRLVAMAFIPNPENKLQVNHINGIKDDNRVENLEWCTNQENQIHAFKIGLQRIRCGEDVWCKLNSKQVTEIKIRLKNGETPKQIQPDYNHVSSDAIYKIKIGATWKHINI